MDTDMKSRELRLRRKASLFGLRLEKNRRRDSDAPDYGTYRLVWTEDDTLYATGSLSFPTKERAIFFYDQGQTTEPTAKFTTPYGMDLAMVETAVRRASALMAARP